MKKILAATMASLLSMSSFTQNSVVYYSPVNDKLEIGIGFDKESHQCIFSIIEEGKSDVDFSIEVLNESGNNLAESSLSDGTVNVIPKSRKVNYYECQYTLSREELHNLMHMAQQAEQVVVNDTKIDGDALAMTIHSLERNLMPAPRRMVRAHRI